MLIDKNFIGSSTLIIPLSQIALNLDQFFHFKYSVSEWRILRLSKDSEGCHSFLTKTGHGLFNFLFDLHSPWHRQDSFSDLWVHINLSDLAGHASSSLPHISLDKINLCQIYVLFKIEGHPSFSFPVYATEDLTPSFFTNPFLGGGFSSNWSP